jgi:hypothetical protein
MQDYEARGCGLQSGDKLIGWNFTRKKGTNSGVQRLGR